MKELPPWTHINSIHAHCRAIRRVRLRQRKEMENTSLGKKSTRTEIQSRQPTRRTSAKKGDCVSSNTHVWANLLANTEERLLCVRNNMKSLEFW